MALSTIYDFNPVSPPNVPREQYTNVGSGENYLGEAARGFKASTFEIWDSATGGTQLTLDVDYEIINKDTRSSALAGYDIKTRYKILNATYQTGNIYITYDVVKSYNTADFTNQLKTDVDTAIAGSKVLKNVIDGLEISNNSTDSDHDIDITAGTIADSTGAKYLTLPSTFTKQIDATFSKGTGNGGLDTGTVANDTFYYFWLIEEDSTSDTDILISASQTSPTMPSGWTAKRRIEGAVLTDGSANILDFFKTDSMFIYDVRIRSLFDTSPGTAQNTQAMDVPPNFIGIFVFSIAVNADAYSVFQQTSQTDTTPSLTNFDCRNANSADKTEIEKRITVDSSSLIAYRTTSGGAAIYGFTLGFIDKARL